VELYRQCKEGEGNKPEVVGTCNKKRGRRACQKHYGIKRSEDVGVVDIAEKVRLRQYGYIIRRDEEALV
jgi:hypothetical protein